ncbi:hypothetical protein [Siminovitchia fordii]|uniref:Uncharacterized protein n=1 Tax=Siminovitchia fordii TaxID=254759 RepID=A0ABQ4KBK4_9BACI|nr:hypothetical protein [Siminovitchia fordii]GIN23114.1 hypothetical protein J1TS3_42480 [Siminovitchia fordii]
MSNQELVVMDTVNVFLKRKRDGHLVAKTKTQMGSISQTVSSEKLYGAIGNQTVAILETQKEVSLSYRNALWDLEYLSMTQGVSIEDKTAKIKRNETAIVESGNDGLTITVKGTPVDNTAVLFDTDGSQQEVAVTTKTIEIPTGYKAREGDTITVVYDEEVTGQGVTFDSAKFSEYYEIEMSTICYDPKTMAVVKDLYIQFDQVKPSGEFEMSFENGQPLTPEISLEAMAPDGTSEMGRVFTVDRASTP